MTRMTFIALAVGMLLTGCTDGTSAPSGSPEASSRTVTVSKVTYVCVGMEKSQRFGSCIGCKYDSDRMDALLRNAFGYSGVLLQSEAATRQSVYAELVKAVRATPEDGLLIFYYSGHGGQEKLNGWGTSEPEGSDSEDEYLCLYDSYLLDDEIWSVISTCRGRVFCCFDACHSQTMYRSVADDLLLTSGKAIPLESRLIRSKGFTLRPRALPMDNTGLRMLCWSGCREAEVSYGGENGGVLTNAMLSNFRNGISYDDLWKRTYEAVQKVFPSQHPCVTAFGDWNREAFR